MQTYFDTNKKLWDTWTKSHLQSKFYDVASWKAGKNSLDDISINALQGEISGRKILHLMCHFGQDTLSLARMGAQVTGVDLSPEAIKTANQLATDLDLENQSRFIESNIYDLHQHLDETFDMIFTSYGVLTWLPDLQKWAKTIYQYLRPGGTFFIAEFHPFLYTFDFNHQVPDFDYFGNGIPTIEHAQGSYADRESQDEQDYYYWTHSLSQTIRPLLDVGLELIDFNEYDYCPYNCFPNMAENQPGKYAFQAIGKIEKLPHVFSLKMRK